MASELVNQAAALRRGFQQVASSQGPAVRLATSAKAFQEAAQAYQPGQVNPNELDPLKRELLALAAELSAFDDVARAAVLGSDKSWVAVQVQAGCEAVGACALLGGKLGLSDGEAYRVSAAGRLLFHTGRAQLAATHQAVLHILGPTELSIGALMRYASSQLTAATSIIKFLLKSSSGTPSGAAPAFAASTGKAPHMLRWLATLTDVMELVAAKADPEYTPLGALAHYCWLVGDMLFAPAFAQHRQVLAGNVSLRQAVTGYLLGRCLPRLAEVAQSADLLSEGSDDVGRQGFVLLTGLAHAARADCLVHAFAARVRQPDGTALVQHIVSIARTLPPSPPPHVPLDIFGGAHGDSAIILAQLCSKRWCPGRLADQGGSSAGGGSVGGGGGGSGREISGGGGGNGSVGGVQEERAAAWAVVALFPHVADTVRALAAIADTRGDAESPVWHRELAVLCTNYLAALEAARGCAHGFFCMRAELAAWMATADAGVRLQPLLAQLHRRWQQPQLRQLLPEPYLRNAARRMSKQLVNHWHWPPPSVLMHGEELTLLEPLWQLHTSTCRLLHWLCRESDAALAGDDATDAALWVWLQHGLHQQFTRACGLAGRVQGEGRIPPARLRQLAAMSAAHWEAVVATTAAVADGWQPEPEAPPDGPSIITNEYAQHFTEALQQAALSCPYLVGPGFLQPLEQPLSALVKAGRRFSFYRLGVLLTLLGTASTFPRLAACFMASPMLPALCLDTLAEAATAADNAAVEQASTCLDNFCLALLNLEEVATALSNEFAGDASQHPGMPSSSVGANGGSSGTVGVAAHSHELPCTALAQQLAAATAELQAQREQLQQQAEEEDSGLAQQASMLRQVLPPAARLATLLQQCWELPDPKAAGVFELAQAAAARSCAYLRCANMAATGGPAAGQGAGSRKCSACRAVRYCGTACSHADWRAGGHKRVCKALAAVQQRQA